MKKEKTDTALNEMNTCPESEERIWDATPKEVKDIVERKLCNPDAPLFLFKGWCKKCGICVELCPHKVFEWGQDGYPAIAKEEACRHCGLCEYRCPDFAITVLKSRK